MKNLGLDDERLPWPDTIKFVGLCGWPGCGKTTIAEMLVDEFGAVIVDDGLILRQALPILVGINPSAPFTQEGKSQVVKIGERHETVRQGLGELGNYIEARYGEDIIPIRALQLAFDRKFYPQAPFYIFPSVRKSQGRVYRQYGGIVIEVNNPTVSPSENAFDIWDKSNVDLVLDNNPNDMGLDDLRDYICELPRLLGFHPA